MRPIRRRAVGVLCALSVAISMLHAVPAFARTPDAPTQHEWAPPEDYSPPAGPDASGETQDLFAPVDALPTEGTGEQPEPGSDQARRRDELAAGLEQVAKRAHDAVAPPSADVTVEQPEPRIGEPVPSTPRSTPNPYPQGTLPPVPDPAPSAGGEHAAVQPEVTARPTTEPRGPVPTPSGSSPRPGLSNGVSAAWQRPGIALASLVSVTSRPRSVEGSPPWCASPDGRWGISLEKTTQVRAVTNTQQGLYDLTFMNRGSQPIPSGSALRYRLFDSSQHEWKPTPSSAGTLSESINAGSSAVARVTVDTLTPGQTWTLLWDMDMPGVGTLTGQGVCAPRLDLVVVNQSPTGLKLLSPSVGATVSGTRPWLAATAEDPDKFPNSQLSYSFTICADHAMTVSCQSSGSQSSYTWQVDTPLLWGGHYWWKASVSDGDLSVDSTTTYGPSDFYVVAPMPDAWRRVGVGLGMATVDGLILPYGVFTSSATDASVAGAGQGLSIDRVWSSGATGVEGGFGRGWMSIFDARVVLTSGTTGQMATVTFPDGRQESFGKNSDGTWASGGALGTTDRFIVDTAGAITVRETSGTVDSFTANGDLSSVDFGDSSWQITRAGSSGDISRLTQMPSGRALDVAWTSNARDSCAGTPSSTRPHVSSVSLAGDDHNAWSYSYQCSRLTSVTGPDGNVTTYVTGAGSFSGTTPNGAPLPGLTSLGTWTYPNTNVRQRTAILTSPGAVDRKVTIMQSTGAKYAETVNSYAGPVVTYCEFRSVDHDAESCPQSQTKILFDTSNRAVVKQVSAPGAAQTPTNSRHWLYSVTDGQLMGFTDENGNTVSYSFDANGNPEGNYVFRDANTQVTNTTFFRSPTATDPQYRISGVDVSPTQTGRWRADMFTYDEKGHLTQRIGNATPAAPNGEVSTFAYTTATSPAYTPSGQQIAGAATPSGLLSSETSGGGVTTYRYAGNGDLTRFTSVGHGATARWYDGRGQVNAESTETSAGGATTSFTRDARGRVVQQDDPCVTNPVTGVTVKKVTLRSFDKDGLVVEVIERAVDCTNGTTVTDDRVTHLEYDGFDRLVKTTGPTGAETSLTYDPANPSHVAHVTDPRGRTFDYTYSGINGKVATETSDIDISGTRVHRLTHSYQYDPAGRLVAESDALGRVTSYTYTGDNLLKTKVRKNVSNTRGKPAHDVEMWRGTYDGRGNVTSETIGGLHRTDYTYDSEGRLESTTVDPAQLKRKTTVSRDAQGRVTGVATSDASRSESVSYSIDSAGNPVSATVENGDVDISTKYLRDVNELLTGIVDPTVVGTSREQDGTTAISYDLLGRRSDVTGPVINTAAPSNPARFSGITTTATRAHSVLGYDAFGDVTEIQDALGAVTRVRYDAAGHRIATIRPDYTPPGAAAPLRGEVDDIYNAAGDLTSSVNERGTTTRYSYDIAGNRTREDVDLGGGKQRSVVTAYDQENQVRAVTSAGGAVTYFGHDELGRLVGQMRMQVEDSCCVDGAATDPTIVEYDDAGDVTDVWAHGTNGEGPRSQYIPPGAHTHYSYNAAGEVTSRTDPGVSNSVSFQRDVKGRVTRESGADGVVTEHVFDLAGREISTTRIGTDGSRQVTSSSFDADGRVTGEVRPNGQHRDATYDLAGRLTQLSEQLTADATRSIVQSFDVVGRPVRMQDADRHLTWRTYNAWGLPEQIVAPLAPGSTNLTDRTWQYSYEPGGLVSAQNSPGGIVRQNTYDAAGQLTRVTATDPHDASASVDRQLTYTTTGDVASIDTPGGSEHFTWGSWDQLLTARGPLMNANYEYDDSRRLSVEIRLNAKADDATSRISLWYDSSGRAADEWTNTNGQVIDRQTSFDDKTGLIGSELYRSTKAGTDTSMGRTDYGYDAFGRRDAVTTSNAAATQTSKTVYAFDAVDDVVSKTVTGQAVPDGGTYGYDLASRLISWQPNAPPGGGAQPAKTTYTWDAANNRLGINDGTTRQGWIYDQRDRIRGSVVETVGHETASTSFDSNPRGDITTIGSRALTYNALDELTSDNGTTFGYDSLGRLASRGQQTLQYDGLATEPSGTIGGSGTNETTVNGSSGATTLSWNLTNKTAGALIANGHSDAVGRLDTSGTLASPTAYDPFGNRTSGSSTAGATTYVGYQGAWTDPATGSVRMGARWYEPTLGRFLTQDTADVPVTNGGSTNLFAYADANPLNETDPSGHFAIPIGGGWGGAGAALISGVANAAGAIVSGAQQLGTTAIEFQERLNTFALAGAMYAVGWTYSAVHNLFTLPQAAARQFTASYAAENALSALARPLAAYVEEIAKAFHPPMRVAAVENRATAIPLSTTRSGTTTTIGVLDGMRTTTQTTWSEQQVLDPVSGRTTLSSRVITGQEWFSEPLVNPARPGMTLTESSIAVARTPAVTTPNRALSSAAESCGMGGTIASCQTPSLGAGLCGSLAATSSLCMPAEPLPGRAGGVQANTPHQNGGAAHSEPGGSSGADASSGGCPPGLEALGLCGNEEADPVATRGGREPVLKGQEGENAVREQYDIGERGQFDFINGRKRIFDGLNRDAVSEVKNVGRQWFSRQLREYADYAKANGLRLDLYVRQGTRLSGSLKRAWEDPSSPVNIIRFLP